MSTSYGTIRSLVQELGTANTVLYVVHRVLERLTGGRARLLKYYIVAQPVNVAPPLREDPKTLIFLAGPDAALRQHFPRPPEVIERRYEVGSQCLCATNNGEFSGFLWWQTRRYEEDEVRCVYAFKDPGQCVWDYDVYVEPRYRLGRTLARLWQAANAHLHEEGVRWSFSRISAYNAASLKAHQRLGLQRRGQAVFLVVGPVQIAVLSMSPFLHCSWTRTNVPMVRLAAPTGGSDNVAPHVPSVRSTP